MNIDTIIVIIGIILIVYVAYLLIRHVVRIKLETFDTVHNDRVILFKTHKWNKRLEKFAKKLYKESVPYKVDFYILVHNDDSAADKIVDPQLRNHVITFAKDQIASLYDKGFYGMWLSNHWILMWFYRQHPNYLYYWTIEYDVRISGNSSLIWSYSGSEDYLYPIPPFQDPNWTWKNHYSGTIFNDNNKWYGYLQLARYSQKFLEYLDRYFRMGENGQDEMIIFSLFKKGENEIGLTGTHRFLNGMIKDSWSVDKKDSDKHKRMLEKADPTRLQIYHPVK